MSAPCKMYVMIGMLALAVCVPPGWASESEGGAVAVEAIGYGTLEPGETLQEVHRKALNDARVNAVVQAKVSVDVNVKVEDMQLKEKGVRTRGMGYIDNMEVQEAGLIPYTDPPVYRVRVRALVKPMPSFPVTAIAGSSNSDKWRPVLALSVKSDLSEEQQKAYRMSVASALRACGIDVITSEKGTPALETVVRIKKGEEGGEEWLAVDWEMDFGEPLDPMDMWGNPGLRGNWLLSGGSSPSSEWWQRLGVMMAQDSVRLWAAPHPVRITVEDATDEQITRLSAALGEGARISVLEERDPVMHVVVMPMAGNPLVTVEDVLRRADLTAALELTHASMAEIAFRQTDPSTLEAAGTTKDDGP